MKTYPSKGTLSSTWGFGVQCKNIKVIERPGRENLRVFFVSGKNWLNYYSHCSLNELIISDTIKTEATKISKSNEVKFIPVILENATGESVSEKYYILEPLVKIKKLQLPIDALEKGKLDKKYKKYNFISAETEKEKFLLFKKDINLPINNTTSVHYLDQYRFEIIK